MINSSNSRVHKPTKKRSSAGRPNIEIDQFTTRVIQRTIFCTKKKTCSIFTKKGKERLQARLEEYMTDFPKMSLSKLHQIVNSIGFKLKKLSMKPVGLLMKSIRIATSTHAYLRRAQRLRKSGYEIFYTNETWCG